MRTVNNASILRTIGQDLQSRDIKAFVISRNGDWVNVQGSYQSPPSSTPISLEYSSKEIDELDGERGQKREETGSGGDFFTLAQTLRAIGAYIDKKGGHFFRISNNESSAGEGCFKIEYETAEGTRVSEDRAAAAVYDICVSMYKLRGRAKPANVVFGGWRKG